MHNKSPALLLYCPHEAIFINNNLNNLLVADSRGTRTVFHDGEKGVPGSLRYNIQKALEQCTSLGVEAGMRPHPSSPAPSEKTSVIAVALATLAVLQ